MRGEGGKGGRRGREAGRGGRADFGVPLPQTAQIHWRRRNFTAGPWGLGAIGEGMKRLRGGLTASAGAEAKFIRVLFRV